MTVQSAISPAFQDSLRDEFAALLRAERWSDCLALYERGIGPMDKQQPGARLAYALALIRSGRSASGVALLTPEVMVAEDTQPMLRRFAIGPLIRERQFDRAIEILDRLLLRDPCSIEDLRLRGSLLGRKRQFEPALADARKLIDLRPLDYAGHTALLQLLLQHGQVTEAGEHAVTLIEAAAVGDHRLGQVVLLALSRSHRSPEALRLAVALEQLPMTDAALPPAIVKAYLDAADFEGAVGAALRLIEAGWGGTRLLAHLGQAYLSSHCEDRYEQAIAHLSQAVEMDDRDAQARALLGEALLRIGRYPEAVEHLAKACALQPRVPLVRAHYARALKQVGRYAEAAREFRLLLKLEPSSHHWHRYAAGALSQAGKREEAAALYDTYVSERAKDLPDDFAAGLAAQWGRIDTVKLPPARLEWAWGLREDQDIDRAEWERHARWGVLADQYILDWLECRDDQVHEAMSQLADLGDAARMFGSVDSSRGMILATAHVGPMYVGPLALELLGMAAKWLASTPGAARTAYANSLISTSDQTSLHAAQQCLASLRKGQPVVIAVDGAINLAAARTAFEGQEITYASFASRAAHRLGIPSLFCASKWVGQRIGFVVERLPDPQPDESADAFAERWKLAYLAKLRDYLGGRPENLRLSGGLWRHIRAPI